jgi:antitoxin (DNA-binding transcriptional repressor) of toxin-antitoxin stability system
MTKDVTVAELQEHLAERLVEVQNGVTLRIVEGERAIAEIKAPVKRSGLTFRPARNPANLRNFDPGPPKSLAIDPVEMLIGERDRERSGKPLSC